MLATAEEEVVASIKHIFCCATGMPYLLMRLPLKINLVVSGSDISAPLERLFLERLLLLSLLLLDVIPVVAAGVLFENVDSIFCDFQMKKTNDFVAGSFQICCLL